MIFANKFEKWRQFDTQLLGYFVSRAALSDVKPDDFEEFMDQHVQVLARMSKEHAKPIEERFDKVKRRYRLG